jgi:hypothetical protein
MPPRWLQFRRLRMGCEGRWRRGELNCMEALKRGKLLILCNARNARNDQYAEVGYAAVTRRSGAEMVRTPL